MINRKLTNGVIDFGLSNLYYTNNNNEINNGKDNNDENNYEYLENGLLL